MVKRMGLFLTKEHKPNNQSLFLSGNNRLYFKNKLIFTNKSLARTGVCNWCRAVKGEVDAKTGILCSLTVFHHEYYHEHEPTKDIIEICFRCHRLHHANKKG